MFPALTVSDVRLHEIYVHAQKAHENAVSANVAGGRCHKMTVCVQGEHVRMTGDDDPQSESDFPLSASSHGCFSLSSNGDTDNEGAFVRMRLVAEGKTVFDIATEMLQDVEVLSRFFDCYYLDPLRRDKPGVKVPIGDFWALNARGHLRCIRRETHVQTPPDNRAVVLLTLRDREIGDFTAEIWFEQSWRRYGCLFGAKRGFFAYACDPRTEQKFPLGGTFACVGSEGVRILFGMFRDTAEDARGVMRWSPPLPAFWSCDATPPLSLPRHTLALHIDTDSVYTYNGERHPAKRGDIVYMPPLTPYTLQGTRNVILRVEFFCTSPLSEAPVLFTPQHPEAIERRFRKLLDCWNNAPDSLFRSMSAFYAILADICAETAVQLAQPLPAPVREAVQYIQHRFTDAALSVSAVAAAVGISESHFYQLFGEAMGVSPKQYILQLRIDHAKRLLSTQYYKVYEVAGQCGFADPKYFITAFKRVTGTSPQQYAAKQGDLFIK